MSDREYIKTSDLKNISKNMNEKKNEIIRIYNDEIKPLLIDSKDCIEYSNQKYDEIDKIFNDSFEKFDIGFDEMMDTLNNKVIPLYENLASNIRVLFNDQFKENFEALVDLNNKGE